MFAIAGVTGNTGSVVAETLLAQGKKVRVIVRDAAKGESWRAKGAEVVIADLSDRAALTRALTDVAGAYLLLPPDGTTKTPLELNAARTDVLVAAIKDARVPHVVFLSSIGAQHADGTGPIRGLHHAEQELAKTGAALTFVRAAYFQENWGAALGMLPQGVLPTFVPAGFAYAQVSTKDIGRTAAAALVEGGAGTQIIELAGPRDLTAHDVAAAAARLSGKPVAASEAPTSAVVPTFTSFGLSAEVSDLYREMYEGIASGKVAWEGRTARFVRGSVTIDETLAKLTA